MAASDFTLLDDQPYSRERDPLGFDQVAGDLANLILSSRASTPLGLGIEGGWGMGKSTLMRRLEAVLRADKQIRTVWFNAWTADEGSALEGLVKSVLDSLDRNILRRAARNEKVLSWARGLGLVLAEWLKIGSVVNTLWREVADDPKARNDMRDLVVRSMRTWARVRDAAPERLLVVFVDDLDRCPPVNVLQVFEAIKLYLDAPGLVFVVGYDRDVVSDAILDVKNYSDAVTSYHYLEKIVQLVYRLPSVSDDAVGRLLDVYLESSATAPLFDSPEVRSLTIDQNSRNPRRIKRFINAFILEYGLDSEWEDMGAETLVRVLIIDVYFPEFGRLLRSKSTRDPVQEFRDYIAVRDILRRRTRSDNVQLVDKVFDSYGLAPPGSTADDDAMLELLEHEIAPGLPMLARNQDFRALLDGFGDVDRLREKVRRFTATTVRSAAGQGRIYISYRRGDSAAYAGRLFDALVAEFGSDRVIFDVDSISAGQDFREAIDAAVRSAAVVLVLIGQKWLAQLDRVRDTDAGDLVAHELTVALSIPGTRVVPMLVAGAVMPRLEDLPEAIAPLARRQTMVLNDSTWDSDVRRLIDTLIGVASTPPAQSTAR